VTTTCIDPGNPWENGYIESFNARMRDGFLNGKVFDTLKEAEVLTRRRADNYNTVNPTAVLADDRRHRNRSSRISSVYGRWKTDPRGAYLGDI